MVDGGSSLTYADWDRRSNATARGLVAAGVRPGDRVALFFDTAHWADYAVAYLGVHKAAAVAVPLSPRFAAPELAHVLDHSGAGLLVCPRDLLPPVRSARLTHSQALETGQSPEAFHVPGDGGELGEIVYTAGTTGSPKGVAITHDSILVHDLPPDPQARAVTFAHAFPVGTNANQECLRMTLRRPATAVVLPSFDPKRLCALVAERRIQRLQLVPAMAQMIVSSGAVERHDVSSVERVTLSSAPTPPALLPRLAAAFPRATLWNTYALTESGSARTLMRCDSARPGSVGRPVGETQVRIVDEGGRDLAAGQTGEVWLRRKGAPRREYYRDPAATAAAHAGDWLRTGDLGYLDDDGYLYLVDRSKDVIIQGGLNVSSLEVENALYEHSEVVEAAAFGLPHDVVGQEVAAAVVARSPIDVRELQSFVRERLAEHKVPRRIFFVEQLPRNASGKVVKRDLRERFTQQDAAASAPPRSDVEAAVASVWREVLGFDEFGVHDDFFALGGHSLAAAQVVARVRDDFAVDLPVTALFEHPTVAELAAAVEEALAEARRS